MGSYARGLRLSASNAKRSEVASSTVTRTTSAEDEDRRMRILAIALMCGTMVCFTGLDTCAKWLSASLPITQIIWTRYVGASLIALAGSRVMSRPVTLRSKRPWLQLARSTLLFGSTSANLLAVHQLQLSETATISFLTPIFVALLAGPLLGEKVSTERLIVIVIGFLGVVIATRPGTAAFQPIVLIAIAGVVCNSGYVLATRKVAGADTAQTTLAWTQIAGIVCLTPILPFVWRQPGSAGAWLLMAALGVFGAAGHGLLIVAHRFAPAPILTPFTYTQLIWMILSGVVVFGDWPAPATLVGAALVVACGAYLAVKERVGSRVTAALKIDVDRKVQ
jgi:drug/metabolite transporter (DMT)-like permease